MGRTKKVKSAGKFSARYGMKARRRYAAIEGAMKVNHECPSCSRLSVKRESSGIWKCRKCDVTFVGGAYLPRTNVAKDSDRVLKNLGAQG
ncbi:MAG TPA: 50S ribosomal protein L37ae [Euryarchaeota archaeon]|nr:50S ribosomal protein L37Ae [archaeon BMS3Abin16]GBE56641.1 50S ribosomal protein L37Ae [archaeon BMS3Bbin16]HDH28466.1 50S ribosomal protein L37ae [Euryarchaeota archaeon]HDY73654.1 50S ribosomal protein L37ae [Euryarchaeota archaeon]